LNNLRQKKGLERINITQKYADFKEEQFDLLAETVREHLDMQKIYEIINE
jgi:adenosylcobyric acid synthase